MWPQFGRVVESARVPRQVFSVYYPYDGSWATIWDPINGGQLTRTGVGTGELDIPIPGLDWDGDGNSDLVVLRATSTTDWSSFRVFLSQPPSTAVSGRGTHSVLAPVAARGEIMSPWEPAKVAWWMARTRAFVVQDMDGDGKPDIMVFDPEEMLVGWFRSKINFEHGDGRAVCRFEGGRGVLL